MKSRKQALAKSVLALLLCVAMLAGTTFAWFTDSVESGYNTIAAGNLDVELYHSNAVANNERVTESTKLFLDLNGDSILWEPGVVSYENLRITNEGDLALIYQLAINTANENYILDNGARYGLSQVLKVGVVEGGITATDRDSVVSSVAASDWTTLSAFLRSGSLTANAEKTWGVVIYWQPGDNDNNWNANNGKQLSGGIALSIDLGINYMGNGKFRSSNKGYFTVEDPRWLTTSEATDIPSNDPIGLKACARFKRLVAVSFEPSERISGLAVVSRKARPNVRMYNDTQKNAKLCCAAAGINSNAPTA